MLKSDHTYIYCVEELWLWASVHYDAGKRWLQDVFVLFWIKYFLLGDLIELKCFAPWLYVNPNFYVHTEYDIWSRNNNLFCELPPPYMSCAWSYYIYLHLFLKLWLNTFLMLHGVTAGMMMHCGKFCIGATTWILFSSWAWSCLEAAVI